MTLSEVYKRFWQEFYQDLSSTFNQAFLTSATLKKYESNEEVLSFGLEVDLKEFIYLFEGLLNSKMRTPFPIESTYTLARINLERYLVDGSHWFGLFQIYSNRKLLVSEHDQYYAIDCHLLTKFPKDNHLIERFIYVDVDYPEDMELYPNNETKTKELRPKSANELYNWKENFGPFRLYELIASGELDLLDFPYTTETKFDELSFTMLNYMRNWKNFKWLWAWTVSRI